MAAAAGAAPAFARARARRALRLAHRREQRLRRGSPGNGPAPYLCRREADWFRKKRGVFAQEVRPRFVELFGGAVAPEGPDRGEPVVARGTHIRAAITDHHRALRVEAVLGKQVPEQVVLVLARAVELAAVDGHEMRVEREMVDDAARVDEGLRGRDVELRPGSRNLAERFRDSVVGRVLEEAHVGEALAKERERVLDRDATLTSNKACERRA